MVEVGVRKLIVACVAALALAAPIASCSSSKPSKGALVDKLKSGGISASVAQCIADKTYDKLSAKDLKANNESDISSDNVKLVENAAKTCQAASGSSNSGSTSS